MTLAEILFAIMLSLQPPGRSVYSIVPAQEGESAPCSAAEIVCRVPWRNAYGWWRYEQPLEGAARYCTIARAIATVATDERRAAAILTVTYHESGWRRDVHSGIDKWSRGDQGRSWCLGQILLGRSRKAKAPLGYVAADLIGVESEPTERCVSVIDAALSQVSPHCDRGGGGAACLFAAYGGVATTGDKRIRARVRTFARVQKWLAEPPPVPVGLEALCLTPSP